MGMVSRFYSWILVSDAHHGCEYREQGWASWNMSSPKGHHGVRWWKSYRKEGGQNRGGSHPFSGGNIMGCVDETSIAKRVSLSIQGIIEPQWVICCPVLNENLKKIVLPKFQFKSFTNRRSNRKMGCQKAIAQWLKTQINKIYLEDTQLFTVSRGSVLRKTQEPTEPPKPQSKYWLMWLACLRTL